MQKYIGTKIIEAEPANRYELHSGGHITKKCSEEWTKDEAEILKQPFNVKAGYAVRYADGYESWSPKDVFEEAYRPTDCMNFGLAIEAAKKGAKITRRGWNGKGMFLYYVPEGRYPARTDAAKPIATEDGKVDYGAYIAMKTAQGNVVPWLASQTDILADDWEVVE